MPADPAPVADAPVAFGLKINWVAVRADDPEPVAAAMGLRDVRASGWAAGVEAAYRGRVFLTPALDGRVLAASADEIDLEGTLEALSAAFGEAWFFGSHRVSSYIAWCCYRDGAPVREFASAEGTAYMNEGEELPAEAAVWAEARRELAEEDDPDVLEDLEGGEGDPAAVMLNEESVLAVAEAVGADPSGFGSRGLPPSTGLTASWPR